MSTVAEIESALDQLEVEPLRAVLRHAQERLNRLTDHGFEIVDEQDEAAWDRLFEDEGKVAGFTREVDASLARSHPRPLDPDRL